MRHRLVTIIIFVVGVVFGGGGGGVVVVVYAQFVAYRINSIKLWRGGRIYCLESRGDLYAQCAPNIPD